MTFYEYFEKILNLEIDSFLSEKNTIYTKEILKNV